MSTFNSFKAYADQLRRWDQRARRKAITLGARAGLRIAYRDATKRFASRGLGRRIWGRDVTGAGGIRKRSNLGAFVRLQRVKWIPRGLVSAIHLKGLAAMVEMGGRTKPHQIPKRPTRDVLAFVSGGTTVFARKVQHPGAAVSRDPFARPALESNAGQIAAKIDERLQASLNREGVA